MVNIFGAMVGETALTVNTPGIPKGLRLNVEQRNRYTKLGYTKTVCLRLVFCVL